MRSRVKLYELEARRREWLIKNWQYRMLHYQEFDYELLSNVIYRREKGWGKTETYNDVYISFDTESSRCPDHVDGQPGETYICAWTISIRFLDMNIVTLYGHRPSEATECLIKIRNHLLGDHTYIFVHNLAWDWQFMRKFFIRDFGEPSDQLNIKPHYPISIYFGNGLRFRDSLIISQVNLDKWAKDLNVEHQKAVGSWDYDKVRAQDYEFSAEELHYIENDTLALVECINAYAISLNRTVYTLPFTATGIVRQDVRKIGDDNNARDWFKRMAPDFQQYSKLVNIFHGGYVQANRYIVNELMAGVRCYDFTSSYPFVLLSERYPSTAFQKIENQSARDILEAKDKYAFMFKLVLMKPRLKNVQYPMPYLQSYKCEYKLNAVIQQGRILAADLVEIYLNEIDLEIVMSQYDYDSEICVEVEYAEKAYLPRWLTDYIFSLYELKSELKEKGIKGIDYTLAKGRLNSVYGLHCMRSIRDELIENYNTGEFEVKDVDEEEEYKKYLRKRSSILPYQIGVWCTSYAARNLFTFASRAIPDPDDWVYSDTDSCYALDYDYAAIYEYNEECKEKLRRNGYGPAVVNGKEFWLGVAVSEGKADSYTEWITVGAKRYCGRSEEDNKLHLTVSGVPKRAVGSLKDDIRNFKKGMVFDGITSGKKMHTYFYIKDIYIDENGNERGDSIDLNPCDYLLDDIFGNNRNIFELTEEVSISVYNEADFIE